MAYFKKKSLLKRIDSSIGEFSIFFDIFQITATQYPDFWDLDVTWGINVASMPLSQAFAENVIYLTMLKFWEMAQYQ